MRFIELRGKGFREISLYLSETEKAKWGKHSITLCSLYKVNSNVR